MANVGFKLGLQSAVDTLLAAGTNAKAVAGSFYLTSDTHRLYIGNSDGSLAPVNEGVITVANISDLPTVSSANAAAYVGRFYYVSSKNILCVFNGKGWAQINTDTTVGKVDLALSQKTANREVKLTQTIENTDGTNTTSVVDDVWSVKGGNGIYVSTATDSDGNPQLVIDGDTYTLGSETSGKGIKLTLDSTKEENDSEVEILPGSFTNETDTNIEITRNAQGKVIVAAKDTSNASMEIKALADGFQTTIVDTFGGDVTATIKPAVKYGKNGNLEAKYVNGVATLDVYSIDQINETLRVLNAMTYRGTIGGSGTVATKIEMLSGTDASKGCTVYKNSTEVKVSVGDMFLVVGNTTVYAGQTLSANTLLIARTLNNEDIEGADGYIPSNKLIFDVVKSTVDIDTTYRIETSSVGSDDSGAKFVLIDERTGADAGAVTLQTERSSGNATGLKIVRETTASADAGNTDVWTITHDTTAFEQTTGADFGRQNTTFNGLSAQYYNANVLTDVAVNETGHVTGFTVRKMPVYDTSSQIESIVNAASAYNASGKWYGFRTATTTEKLVTGNTNVTTDNFAFVSESLQIKTSGNVATTDGGTTVATGLQIDMVWGTF